MDQAPPPVTSTPAETPGRQQVDRDFARPEPISTYWARRRRNNEAARRCRERRRMEELLLELRALELLRENQQLRATLNALYPGHPATDWTGFNIASAGQTFPVQHEATRVPYRPWNTPPVYQAPPAVGSLMTHVLDPHTSLAAQIPSPSVPLPSPLCPHPTVPPGAASPHCLGDPTPPLLPHKLRLKGTRALSLAYGGTQCPAGKYATNGPQGRPMSAP